MQDWRGDPDTVRLTLTLVLRLHSYGLLGASGCGKTTLLTCIVGRRSLNEGTIEVLGRAPGSEGSGLPGATVGYMPQVRTVAFLWEESSLTSVRTEGGAILILSWTALYEVERGVSGIIIWLF